MRWWVWIVLLVIVVLWIGGGSMATAVVSKIARAIARAEGFWVKGSRSQRNHNPGNITKDLTGRAIGMDGMYVVFANDSDGWSCLEKQVQLMFSGSRIYNPEMTITEISRSYTTTQQEEWARNVAQALGVTVTTRLKDIEAEDRRGDAPGRRSGDLVV